MSLCLVGVCEQSRGFDHYLRAYGSPVDLRGVPFSKDSNLMSIYAQTIFAVCNVGVQNAEHGVILKKVSQCMSVSNVIDADKLDTRITQSRADNIAPDSTETINSDFN